VPIVFKSGSLNLLEPYVPVKACNGIALLLLYLTFFCTISFNSMISKHVAALQLHVKAGYFFFNGIIYRWEFGSFS
jgi:hypothetical protein